jgi:hypothetical protein
MSEHALEEAKLDVDTLREAIREEYVEVATNQEKGFHIHTGRPLARNSHRQAHPTWKSSP